MYSSLFCGFDCTIKSWCIFDCKNEVPGLKALLVTQSEAGHLNLWKSCGLSIEFL